MNNWVLVQICQTLHNLWTYWFDIPNWVLSSFLFDKFAHVSTTQMFDDDMEFMVHGLWLMLANEIAVLYDIRVL